LIYAAKDPLLTLTTLKYFPGLWRSQLLKEDALRAKDLAANIQRTKIVASSKNPKNYLKTLQIVMHFFVNKTEQIARMVELSQKTNQFNLTLSRFNELQLAQKIKQPEVRVITIGLRDRLSDSGLIGLLVISRDKEALRIEELAISCRALGRGLENMIVAGALNLAFPEDVTKLPLMFRHSTGSRNHPARSWLAQRCCSDLSVEGWQSVPWWGKEAFASAGEIIIKYN
jgi:FkbH-like protein